MLQATPEEQAAIGWAFIATGCVRPDEAVSVDQFDFALKTLRMKPEQYSFADGSAWLAAQLAPIFTGASGDALPSMVRRFTKPIEVDMMEGVI